MREVDNIVRTSYLLCASIVVILLYNYEIMNLRKFYILDGNSLKITHKKDFIVIYNSFF